MIAFNYYNPFFFNLICDVADITDQNVTIIDRMLRKWRNEVLDRARVDKYVNT